PVYFYRPARGSPTPVGRGGSGQRTESLPVRARGDPDGLDELRPEIARRSETDLPGDAVDGVVGGLQQLLGVPDAHARDPLDGALPGLLGETPGESAHTHPGDGGDLGQGRVA